MFLFLQIIRFDVHWFAVKDEKEMVVVLLDKHFHASSHASEKDLALGYRCSRHRYDHPGPNRWTGVVLRELGEHEGGPGLGENLVLN